MNAEQTPCRRKERRFKTADGQSLRCECFVEDGEPKHGTIVDISPSGLRILSDGKFNVGQNLRVELKTDRSHGTYRGVIRRAVPWVGGTMILGCQLTDKIPDAVLQCLAHEGIVNRRRDNRVDWNQPARMSSELRRGEVEIQIKDCSLGGMRIVSLAPVPDDVRLRIHVAMGEEELMAIDARVAWQIELPDGWTAGLAFTHKQVPEAVTRFLAESESESTHETPGKPGLLRRGLLVASALVVLGLALLEITLNAK